MIYIFIFMQYFLMGQNGYNFYNHKKDNKNILGTILNNTIGEKLKTILYDNWLGLFNKSVARERKARNVA